jgi:hypothetical protein
MGQKMYTCVKTDMSIAGHLPSATATTDICVACQLCVSGRELSGMFRKLWIGA